MTLDFNTKHGLVPFNELIELLEYKLESLIKARDEDSSWNYGINELESKIRFLKENL